MKVLLDTNILLDVPADRGSFAEPAARVFKLCEVGQLQGVVYALSIANIVYILRRELDRSQIGDVLEKLSAIFTIADMTAADLKRAAKLPMQDYEDALQSACARRIKADFIITRNVKDFKNSRTEAITPNELLERLSRAQ